ncbi:MAG: flagellar biosynthesis protein FlhF [Lachnospiraceae bacterium]|nr:flagellar biosynthesis protein FlhF [Lachnospiraceae bacterium]
MIIKKFQGKTKEDALNQAYKELGSNIVEMNTRNVNRKGLFGFLMPQLVEVTVALEEETPAPKTSQISEAIAGVRSVAEAAIKNEEAIASKLDIRTPEDDLPVVKSAIELLTERQNQEKSEPERIVSNSKHETSSRKSSVYSDVINDNSVIEEKLDSLHNMLEAQLQKPEEPEDSDGIFTKTPKESDDASGEVEKFIKLLYNKMIDNEVNEKYANQIIDEMEKNTNPNMPFEMALANTYQKMILKFGNPSGITPATKGPKVVFFVGPTGVGKTTTIAKIASKFSVEGGKKVALLTADTYRIAAAEQLRTYANILEIPFRIIYTTEEVEGALRDFKDYDYVLVDTAGHSHQNQAQAEAMNGFIHSVDGSVEKEVFLVVSATTKYRDLVSIADTYSKMTDYKLIFTKLDETTTLGNLLNLRLHTGAALSYVTCGQNVPDDIERFNPQRTVKQLLGGRKS